MTIDMIHGNITTIITARRGPTTRAPAGHRRYLSCAVRTPDSCRSLPGLSPSCGSPQRLKKCGLKKLMLGHLSYLQPLVADQEKSRIVWRSDFAEKSPHWHRP